MYWVLIVDDEHLIRRGLRYTIPWETIGFKVSEEAASAAEALKKLENIHIDVAIIDINMPEMNGLELIQTMQKKFPHIKTIIISGYNDFNYCISALKMGVSNYILKPINKNDIILAFTELKGKLDDEWRLQGVIQAKGNASRKLFIQRLLNSDFINQEELLEYSMKYGISFSTGDFCVIVVRIHKLANIIRDQFNNSRQGFEEALDGFLVNSIKEIGLEQRDTFSTLIGNNYAILTVAKDSGELAEHIAEYVNELTTNFRIGIGEENDELNYMSVSYLQALEAIMATKEEQVICKFNWKVNKKEIETSRKVYLGKLIIEKLDEGKYQELELVLEMIFSELGGNDNNVIFNWCVNSIYKIIEYFSINSFSSKKIISDFDIIAITSDFSIQSIRLAYKDKLDKIVEYLNNLQTGSVEYIVKNVCEIANQEFSDPNLSLQNIAQRQNISYGYLSTAFKQVIGENFSTYLADIKMNYARKLIIEGQNKINEIADKVGYSSARYFTDQFRKHFGVSPSEYKARLSKQKM